ncbi:hypothetical protein M5X00_30350 [Paenibacillus alvei]|nr:hypothetical protein [Paenibacillus alvei]MCY9544807.1 hypothetical protein [Paenibacillus alvei]MCY9708571.1 hypothetical protein [Paenibacillus alvei]MCY9738335.1 hypothetical protein [Paenibacillus alvei]MCY9758525.1 hypothetical protein [Paenibacillus alvei]MEC0084653.1 hypothetical protein [Paenibacillus alvei]
MNFKAASIIQLCAVILDGMATVSDIEQAGNELYKRLREGKGHEMQG